jgi:hypothetical protein
MIDRDPTFAHHLFKIAQAQRVCHVPTHAQQHHVQRIVQPLQHFGYRRTQRFHCRSTSFCKVPPHTSLRYRNRTRLPQALTRRLHMVGNVLRRQR